MECGKEPLNWKVLIGYNFKPKYCTVGNLSVIFYRKGYYGNDGRYNWFRVLETEGKFFFPRPGDQVLFGKPLQLTTVGQLQDYYMTIAGKKLRALTNLNF